MSSKSKLVRPSVAMVFAGTMGLAGPALTDAADAASTAVTSNQPTSAMKLRITVGDSIIPATLADNETARDFASLLPLTLKMDDLFKREKFAPLPRAISTAGPRSRTYAVGDVILWSPGPDVAIFYRHDGQTIPSPGSILIARTDAAVTALSKPGLLSVTIERVAEPRAPGNSKTWSQEELAKMAAADDLHISPFREDGVTYGTPTWIWSVTVDGALYVRAYNGTNSRWYQAAVREKAGRIRAAGMTREVSFETVGDSLNDRIDDAYREKYRKSQYLAPMISARARAATIRVLPRESRP